MKLLICLAILLNLCASSAKGQTPAWPSAGPVTILIANSTGTTPDVVTSLLAQHLDSRLGQRVLVEAKLGGAGITATVAAARAKPDGYTVYMSGNSPFALHPFMFKSLPYDQEKDFTPIALIIESAPMFVAADPRLNAKSMAEMIGLARAQPGKISWASGGTLA